MFMLMLQGDSKYLKVLDYVYCAVKYRIINPNLLKKFHNINNMLSFQKVITQLKIN